MYFKTLLIAATTAALLFSGCKDGRSTDLQDSLVGNTVDDKIAGYAVFNPDEGLIPYPNNILFAPNSSGTNDYDYGQTLNIPYEESDPDANIKRQLNTLTGFSTTSPITAPITGTLDPSTIAGGVQFYKVDINASSGAVTGINATLQFGVDYIAAQSGSKLAVVPLHPLDSLSNYMVVLTSDLKDTQGRALSPDIATALTLSPKPLKPGGSLDTETAAALEAIRQGNMAMLAALSLAPDDNNVVQIWNFRTQMIGAVQDSIATYSSTSASAQLALNKGGMTTKQAVEAALGYEVTTMDGIADAYFGTLSNLPQFMPDANATNYEPAIKGQFRFNEGSYLPVIEVNATIPVIAAIPNNCGDMPAAGWPVVIYQHGITRNRTDLFAYAETFASKCYASVAIDLPLHGLTESNLTINPFFPLERTFNLDIVTEDEYGNIVAEYQDGIIDSSGAHYINLSHIATTRDNLHQTTADLLQLEQALASATINTGATFNTNRIHFVTHSLGAIASTGYINKTSGLKTITLAMPGQGLAQLLNNSMDYGPVIEAGLAQKGIIKGTLSYDAFMLATQTIVDDADPANYSISVGQTQTANILAFEVVGSGITPPCDVAIDSDNVIPNCVATAPLSGTEPYLISIGAQDLNITDGNPGLKPTPNNTVTKFTQGDHSSPLRPDIATAEMHGQILSFIDSNGTAVLVQEPSIIQQ